MKARLAVVAALVALGIAAIVWPRGGPSGAAPGLPGGPGVAPAAVTYRFAWALGNAAPHGAGFVVPHGDGRVVVDALAVVVTSASLVPCTPPEPPKPPVSLLDLVVPRAWAGHAYTPDPAQIDAPKVHTFAARGELTLGGRPLDGARYCRLHWLVARGPTHGPHDMTAQGWAGVSLRLSGRYEPRTGAIQPFALETGMANGTFRDAPEGLADGGALGVRVVWQVDTLFEGLTPADLSERPDITARKVLGNLFRAARVEMTPQG